jgi:hypothetical protein
METKTSNRIISWLVIAIILIALFALSIPNLMRNRATRPHENKEEASIEPIKITIRDYLLKDENEDSDYGLFSYLLFSRKPATEKETERYIALHAAYRSLHGADEYEQPLTDSLLSTKNINVTYWLTNLQSETNLELKDSLESLKATDKFFVDNYDYFRADLILNEIKGIRTPGPFIISYHYPLTKLPEEFEKDELLVIDLSRVDQGQFATILDYFQRKVLDDVQTWRNKFDWELIRIHVYSALTLHGEPILYAAKWVGDFFDVKKAFASPN